MLDLIRLTQQDRGICGAYLNGAKDQQDACKSKRTEVHVGHPHAMKTALSAYPDAALTRTRDELMQRWSGPGVRSGPGPPECARELPAPHRRRVRRIRTARPCARRHPPQHRSGSRQRPAHPQHPGTPAPGHRSAGPDPRQGCRRPGQGEDLRRGSRPHHGPVAPGGFRAVASGPVVDRDRSFRPAAPARAKLSVDGRRNLPEDGGRPDPAGRQP